MKKLFILSFIAFLGLINLSVTAKARINIRKAAFFMNQAAVAKEDKNYILARQLDTKLCDAGYHSSCGSAADMYVLGQGVKQSYSIAAKFYKKGCPPEDDYDIHSCERLGWLYENGQGVKKSYSIADKFYKRSCHNRGNHIIYSQLGCGLLGNSYDQGLGVLRDYHEAIRLYKKGCNDQKIILGKGYAIIRGNGWACVNLALYYQSGGDGIRPNLKKALQLYREACKDGYTQVCNASKNLKRTSKSFF